ncbi:MAG TPA: Holliday junction branch migration protein RuvA [Candidatus Eubacterium faecavium]|nr:Holliday junction branch migration protein RuvA [Candidatus Eubacterium faecavium]
MIYSLTGELAYIGDQFLVIECGGVGFKCFTSLNSAKTAGKVGEKIRLFTYLSVKEDSLDLFGFKTENELNAFKMLISVSGVGPKAAVSVLSELSADKLALAVAAGDVKAITKANGVGKKIAERIVLELKDKMAGAAFGGTESNAAAAAASVEDDSPAAEAVAALVALGYGRSDAAAVIGAMDQSLPADELIRLGLRQLARNL